MVKKYLLFICFIVLASIGRSQSVPPDSVPHPVVDSMLMDDSLDIDDLFNDLDLFLDSILAPRSYFLVSLSAGQGYFSFVSDDDTKTREQKKFIWSPTLGYYDKSGFGILMNSYMINDSSGRNWYQSSISPSYDYISDRRLATGIAYTRYFTKRTTPFYTTPIQNEVGAYFLWRKSWLQPGVMANLGWGSRTEFTKREVKYTTIVSNNLRNQNIPVVNTVTIVRRNKESIVDFSLAGSVRHDFYWLDIFSKKDYIRLSPIVSLTGGTQKFGFNQTTGAFGPLGAPLRSNAENISLQQKFQLLSGTFYLRGEYAIGKFFIEPQLLIDYYFPGAKDVLTTALSVTTGFMF